MLYVHNVITSNLSKERQHGTVHEGVECLARASMCVFHLQTCALSQMSFTDACVMALLEVGVGVGGG